MSGGSADPQLERSSGCKSFEGICTAACINLEEISEPQCTPTRAQGQNCRFDLPNAADFSAFILQESQIHSEVGGLKHVKVIRLPFSQVEQLFSLGLRSRSECEELLQRCNWNLEESSTVILDSAGCHDNESAQLNR